MCFYLLLKIRKLATSSPVPPGHKQLELNTDVTWTRESAPYFPCRPLRRRGWGFISPHPFGHYACLTLTPDHSLLPCPCAHTLSSIPSCNVGTCMLGSFSRVQLFEALWTVAHQALLSMGFSRQEHWSWRPFSSPRDLPDPGIEHTSFVSCTGRRVLYD